MQAEPMPCLAADPLPDNIDDAPSIAAANANVLSPPVNVLSPPDQLPLSEIHTRPIHQQASSFSPGSEKPRHANVEKRRNSSGLGTQATSIPSSTSTIAGVSTHHSHPDANPPRKRTRFHPDENRRYSELIRKADELRKQGTIPQTLFFPSLPAELTKDSALRAAIGCRLKELKTHQAKNKKMAWATFASETECLDRLFFLNTSLPALRVSLHRPRPNQDSSLRQQSGHAQAFDKRVQGILSRGGIGNTLMFRNLPLEVECDELENVLHNLPEMANVSSPSLRVRMALGKGRGGRNFWIVYASVEACRAAFIHLMHKQVSFRCGKSIKLHPIVHDDTTDVDETKRRDRARALGSQRSKTKGNEEEASTDIFSHLEAHLRATQKKLYFLSSQGPGR